MLCWWITRLPSLESLPLHNDEGLHLTRAVEVWNLHPFWEIRDGKIVNHFVIAAFYPQNAPVFIGRIATLFVSVIGLAAGYALIRRHFGGWAAALAALFWIASPYLLFFERLTFSDAEAGALVIVALWAADRLARSGMMRDALLTGFCFGLAALFKFTAIPFTASVAVVVLLTARYPLAKRLRLLVVAGVVTAAMFVVPVGYLLARGDDLFSIALAWLGGNSGGTPAPLANLARLTDTLIGFSLSGAALLIVGLGTAIIALFTRQRVDERGARRRYRDSGYAKYRVQHPPPYGIPMPCILLLALAIPLAVIILLGREVLPRHFVVALPLALILAAAGFATLFDRLTPAKTGRKRKWAEVASVPQMQWLIGRTGRYAGVLGILLIPFILNLRTQLEQPELQPMPEIERHQFITDHSAGYGLREAVLNLPVTTRGKGAPIFASMFPDSCRRANFYAVTDLTMTCIDAHNTDDIVEALREHRVVYVLVESRTLIGVDIREFAESIGATVTRIAGYPRPGESVVAASVVLWRVEN